MENNEQSVWCNVAQRPIPESTNPDDCPCKDTCGYQIVECPLLKSK